MTKAGKHTTKPPSQEHALPLSSGMLDAPLSPQWAFLVQFRAAPEGPAYDAGRVEHLVSGRTSHFQSLQELLAYLLGELRATDQTLEAVEKPPSALRQAQGERRGAPR